MTDPTPPTAHPDALQIMQNPKHTVWNKHNVNLTKSLQSALHERFLKLFQVTLNSVVICYYTLGGAGR